MNERLPPPYGRFINRHQRVDFRFEGKNYQGYAGDTLTSALWANGVRLLGRSFKYHRPRGLYSLAGHDATVMVDNGRETNIRGDTLRLPPGLEVSAVNTSGGLRNDRMKVTERFSRFLPVGFYYKAFHTPRRLFQFCEQQMRKVAGLGQIHAEFQLTPSPKSYDFCDVLVIGAGPSGLAAAIAAAEQGLDVLIVDENHQVGGSLLWQDPGVSPPSNAERSLIERAEKLETIRMRLGTQAVGCYADRWVALIGQDHLTKVRAGAIVFATGCIEQPAVFQNNDLPGVMLGSAAQRLMSLYGVKPCQLAIVLAANSNAYRVALDLSRAGVELAGIVDLRHEGEMSDLSKELERTPCPVFKGYAIEQVLPRRDRIGLRGVQIRQLGTMNLRSAKLMEIPCDGVVASVGWGPNSSLISQSGGRFRYLETLHQLVPFHTPPGIFTAGKLNAIYTLESRLIDGTNAGLTAAQFLGKGTSIQIVPVSPSRVAHSHPYPIFEHPGKKNFVDLDEDIHLSDLTNAHQEGFDNIELMKRYTTVGMGPSQGKLSNMNAIRVLARLNGKSIQETGTTTARPFYQPVSLRHLAGRRFHPVRRTSLHHWHLNVEAEMTHVGAWLRPAFYRVPGANRDETILAEARHVRESVGMIDVGTLGKLHVRGPDAVEFLERIYTGRFADQKVGRLRYAIACDEAGTLIEDGIVCRLRDDHFYITASSSGSAAFFREMQRWLLIWGLNVTLINVTGQSAAINLVGPRSRELLQPMTDLDLGESSFPYLGVREGHVAGVPARFIRVGFVGELGYEIHFPTSYGLYLWQELYSAGRSRGIRPFGIEAQRLLRLEKGHLIVGQDTDAMTTPDEANLGGLLATQKPFFIGARSLQVIKRRPLTRQIVGLTFSPDEKRLPEECHLIYAADDIAGRITSIAHQTTIGAPIALAFLRPDLAKIGESVEVRLSNGTQVMGRVTEVPFYDPKNRRQQ